MITYTKKHFNLDAIVKDSGLVNEKTKLKYHVYGLLNSPDYPDIVVSYYENQQFKLKLKDINAFLHFNNINLETDPHYVEEEQNVIRIALKKKLRQNKNLCIKLIKTVIFSSEGKLKKIPMVKIKK